MKVGLLGNREFAKEKEVCSLPTTSLALGAPEKEQIDGNTENCLNSPAEPIT